MSELKEFITKRTINLSGISSRKLYGLDAFYLNNIPFIVITSNEQIVIKVDDFEVKKVMLKTPNVSQWVLDSKNMENWFILPETFNKKKGKLDPILKMTSRALINPKKEKKKNRKKSNIQNKTNKLASETAANTRKKVSFFKRIHQFFQK